MRILSRLLVVFLIPFLMVSNGFASGIDVLADDKSGAAGYWYFHGKASDDLAVSSFDADLPTSIILSLDEGELRESLDSTFRKGTTDTVVYFPNTDGKMLRFQVREKPNFSPVLAAKFPGIKAYRGFSLDHPEIRMYFSDSPFGLEATIIDSESNTRTTIRKISQSDSRYIAYTKLNKSRPMKALSCSTPEPLSAKTKSRINPQANLSLSGEMSRLTKFSDESALTKYRLAVAANGQYTSYHGGTKEGGLSAINTTLTGINFILETDIGVKLELIDNNDEIIYTDSNTDPFEDTIDGNTNAPLQATIDSAIGSANYDIGHLFSGTGGGGNAGAIGAVCNDAYKGSAWSASGQPRGNSFVNLVAHEMGHQIGANHTFSFRSEGTGVNVEPASGSTIMGYAGTGSDDMAFYADNYYHNVSIVQSLAYLKSQTCAVTTTIENNVPTVDALIDRTIPVATPFILTGSASDLDASDSLTYTWEQKDDGVVPSETFGPTNTQGANFRSLLPSQEPTRYLPLVSSVISGNLTLEDPYIGSPWETLSTVPREFNFAFTVRDNSSGGGGVAYTEMKVTVVDNDGDDDSIGAFAVTSQSLGNVYIADSPRMVTWNVAGTDQAPISVSSVNITMSTDGGLTYPYSLAENTANDGSHEIIMPDVVTSTARIRVASIGNIFYSINTQDFSVTRDDIVLTVNQLDFSVCQNDSVTSSIIYETATKYTDIAVFSAENGPSGISVAFNPTSATTTDTSVDVTFTAAGDLAAGTYPVDVVATSPERTQRVTYNIKNFSPDFEILNLSAPVNGATIGRLNATLHWEAQSNADNYVLEIASDQDFNNVLLTRTVSTNSTVIKGLTGNTLYFWRVAPNNFCGSGTAGTAYSFTTPDQVGATDLPKSIADVADTTVTSTLTVAQNLRIIDVNVYLGLSHTWPGDLTVTLTSPAGITIDLLVNACGGTDDIDVVFDDEGSELECSVNPPSVSGVIRPQSGALSIFNEQSSQGDWTLTVLDGYDLDGGSIDYLALEITSDGEWSNTAPIAFPQSATTSTQFIALKLEGLDPERLPLTYELVDVPSDGDIIGANLVGTILETVTSSGQARDVALSNDGNTLFVADYNAGLRIIDVTDPINAVQLGVVDTAAGTARGIAVSSDNKTVYLANAQTGLQLVDVSDLSSPALLGVYNTPGTAQDVIISPDGNTAFVADNAGGLQIIDVSNTTNPSLISSLGAYTSAYDIDVSADGNFVYIADQVLGLGVVSVEDISNPISRATLATDGFASGVKLSNNGQKAYLADFNSGVQIFDLTNPDAPIKVGSFDTSGSSYKIDVSNDGEKIYVADSTGLKVLDVRTPASVELLADIILDGVSYGVASGADGNSVFVASGSGGINVVGLAIAKYRSGDTLPQDVIFQSTEEAFVPEGYSDSFTFRVSDGDLLSNTAFVDVLFATEPKNDGVWTYIKGNDGNVSITGCLSVCPASLDIPSVINGSPVTAISSAAFAESEATLLNVPNTVTSIGDYAFVRSNIAKATIGSSVSSIGASAFAYNQLVALSFLGDKPTLAEDSFLTNRALDYISYCADKLGWPGGPISTGTNLVTPVVGCDSVNKNNASLAEVVAAVQNGDATSITAEDLSQVLGLENIDPSNIDLYQGMIQLSLNLTFGEVRIVDFQALIDNANKAVLDCALNVYIIDVSQGENGSEVSWELKDSSGEQYLSGGAPYNSLVCIADGRYTLQMSDTNAAGTNNGWDFSDFVIAANTKVLFTHTLNSGTSGSVAVNVGNYPNQAPVADEMPSENLEQAQVFDFVLSATDADDDPLTYILETAPEYGSVMAYAGDTGIIGDLFLGGGGGVRGVAVSSDDKYVFLADYTDGLKVLDISNPEKPTIAGTYPISAGQLYNIALSADDQTVFVASVGNGVMIFDVSDPAKPVLLSTLAREGTAYPLDIVMSSDGNTLFVAAYEFFLTVDVSDPANPVLKNSVGTDDYAWGVALSSDDKTVYLASGFYMQVFDVTDSASPVSMTSFPTEGTARSIRLSVDDSTAYLANGSSGMQIVDVNDSSQPLMMGSIASDESFMFALTMSGDGKHIYTTDDSGLLRTIDVADGSNPVQVRSTAASRDTWRIDMSSDNKLAFLADGYTGFKVVDVSYSERSAGSRIEPNLTYTHSGQSSASDSFSFKVNDGLDDSNISTVVLKFKDDRDNDGIEDNDDNCPAVPNQDQVDTDGDLAGDACDDDDDDDGVPDASDALPLDNTESVDTDGDGVGNNTDTDDDGDTIDDSADNCPVAANSNQLDTDGDLTGNVCDDDDDNDGVIDSSDAFPLDSSETVDSDGDGVGDNSDWAPNDSSESVDSDGDGVGDNADAFPSDATETLDTDGDGTGDNSDTDIDGDGVLNGDDPFPNQAEYTLDSDGDGMPDAWETRYGLNPNDASDATSDQDNDGVTALQEFLAGTIPAGSLDIDGNEVYDALTDGLLLLRGMFGLDGSALVSGTIGDNATYTSSEDVEARIAMLGDLSDIDGNGEIDALTDGLLTLRYLFGLEGEALVNGVIGNGATRTSASEIEAHLEALTPAP